CRTAAPARGRGPQLLGVEALPPATCRPYFVSSKSACSTRPSFQSASNSSARIIGRCVFTPWPTSGFFERIVTIPSGATRMNAIVSNACTGAWAGAPDAAWAAAAAVAPGRRYQPIRTPPPAAELTFRKDRRFRTAPDTRLAMLAISHLAGWKADSNAERREPHAKLSTHRPDVGTIPASPQNEQM